MQSQGHMGTALFRYTGQVAPQIWGFRFTWGVEMMPQCHGWGWYPLHTTSYIHIRHIHSVWDIGMLSQGHMVAPLYRYTGQVGPRFGKSGSLEVWKRSHNIMVEAYIHAPLIVIVSCECPHSSSLPRGTSSPHPNMVHQPAFPHKASCQGSTHRTPRTADCDDTLWEWSCWAHPYWPQALQVWWCCWDRLNIPNRIGWCADGRVVLHLPHCNNLSRMGQSIALHPLMLALP